MQCLVPLLEWNKAPGIRNFQSSLGNCCLKVKRRTVSVLFHITGHHPALCFKTHCWRKKLKPPPHQHSPASLPSPTHCGLPERSWHHVCLLILPKLNWIWAHSPSLLPPSASLSSLIVAHSARPLVPFISGYSRVPSTLDSTPTAAILVSPEPRLLPSFPLWDQE